MLAITMVFALFWLIGTSPFAFAEAGFSWRPRRPFWSVLSVGPAIAVLVCRGVTGWI